jgi:hypothetical protein
MGAISRAKIYPLNVASSSFRGYIKSTTQSPLIPKEIKE